MVGEGPTGTEQVRRDNTALVLRALRAHGPATRTGLAQRTGLAKATVGVIVGSLERAGVVVEQDAPTAYRQRGRPGRPVGLRGAGFVGVGFELNVDYVGVVVLDLEGAVAWHRTVGLTDPGAGESALRALAGEVRALSSRQGRTVLGATVAVPALVRSDDRTVDWAPNVATAGTDVAVTVERVLEVPVRVANDASCAAYAEARHGAAVGASDALYLTGTVGIGAGIISGGELVRGAGGFAGEVGHIPIGDPGAACGCGRCGCWEASIGLHAMLAAVGRAEIATPVETAAAVARDAEDDPAVRAGLARIGETVGLGVALLTSVLDPAVVVLGGYFVPLGDLILAPARRILDERLASPTQPRPRLLLSPLGLEAAALGAAEQSLEGFFAGQPVPATA